MKLNTCITRANGAYVNITELTDGKQYLPEGSGLTAKNRFAYRDTASIDVFRLNSLGNIKYTSPVIVDRNNPVNIKINLERDGWFTSIHIVVPTKKWVYKELSKQGSIIHTYDIVYFVDNNEIYTYVKGKIEKTCLKTLLNEVNPNTTISKVYSNYVSIRHLNELCDNLYKKLFENRIYNGGCNINACEANRLNAIISLIKHYVRCGQLAEAERVIEKADYFRLNGPNLNYHQRPLIPGCGCQ